MLLSGKGEIVVKHEDRIERITLKEKAVLFIPKLTEFYFNPQPEMEIFSATGPAWNPRQQKGLDYRRKESGRMIL